MRNCFGLISAFNFESECCQKCESFDECSDEVIKTACKIEKAIDIRPILKKHLELKKNFPTVADLPINYKYQPIKKVKMAFDTKLSESLSAEDKKYLLGLNKTQKAWVTKLLSENLRTGDDLINKENAKKVPTLGFLFQMAILIQHGFNSPEMLKTKLKQYNSKLTDSSFKTKYCNALGALKAMKIVTGEHRYELQVRNKE
jgi:hypothetical protein